jgi:hypothetical protein
MDRRALAGLLALAACRNAEAPPVTVAHSFCSVDELVGWVEVSDYPDGTFVWGFIQERPFARFGAGEQFGPCSLHLEPPGCDQCLHDCTPEGVCVEPPRNLDWEVAVVADGQTSSVRSSEHVGDVPVAETYDLTLLWNGHAAGVEGLRFPQDELVGTLGYADEYHLGWAAPDDGSAVLVQLAKDHHANSLDYARCSSLAADGGLLIPTDVVEPFSESRHNSLYYENGDYQAVWADEGCIQFAASRWMELEWTE